MNIKIAETDQERKDALYVRHLVFVQEQKVPENIEIDEFEQDAIHFIGYYKQQPIAAGRLRFIDHYGKLERLCVLKNFRGNDYGKQMLKEMEKETLSNHFNHTLLNAQSSAIPFYEKVGYQVASKPFTEAGIIHVTMTKQLK